MVIAGRVVDIFRLKARASKPYWSCPMRIWQSYPELVFMASYHTLGHMWQILLSGQSPCGSYWQLHMQNGHLSTLSWSRVLLRAF